MPKVSKWRVEPEKASLFKEDFWSVVTLLKDKKQVRSFLTEFLTPTERLMLAKRFQTVLMIRAGADYTTIKDRLHISVATIAKLTNQITDEQIPTVVELADKVLDLKGAKWVLREVGYPKRKGAPGDLLSPVMLEVFKGINKIAFEKQKKESVTQS